MALTELQNMMLAAAYQNDIERQVINFNDWGIEQDISNDEVWSNYDDLEHWGYIKPEALGGDVSLTGKGVILCEEMGIALPDRITQDHHMRTYILNKVAQEYETHGRNSIIPIDITRPEEPFDENQWDFNLAVLLDIGLLSSGPVIGSIQITERGNFVVQDWKRRSLLFNKFNELEGVDPAASEIQLSSLVEQLFTHYSWTVVSRSKLSFVMQYQKQYYYIYYLCQDQPIGLDSLNTLVNDIGSKPIARAIFISLSGFNHEVTKNAKIYSSRLPIILIEKPDINRLLEAKAIVSRYFCKSWSILVLSFVWL